MILCMENLSISFYKNNGYTPVVRHLNMEIFAGEMLGVVGESGSGKSLTNLALMGLLPHSASMDASKLEFKNRNLLSFTHKDWQSFRGNEITMIFQNAKRAMNPAMKIKHQLTECIKKNKPGLSRDNRQSIANQLLEQVGLCATKINLEGYPHELSGGTAQRFMIAMALASNPSLLIADEITAGLDNLHKKQILELLDEIRREKNMAVLIVSHDIHLIQAYTQRMHVMYSGELMESGLTQDMMKTPKHPYTKGLIDCMPKVLPLSRVPAVQPASFLGQKTTKQHLNTIEGLMLPITEKTQGCRFYNRCPTAFSSCLAKPVMKKRRSLNDRFVNCHLWDQS